MTATVLLAGLLMSQSAMLSEPLPGSVEKIDVAYDAMAKGQSDQAIAQLRARSDGDAATLINLGTAYARKGMRPEALAAFNAAMAADRYDLQLADGRWMDSRLAARLAAAQLDKAGTLAAR